MLNLNAVKKHTKIYKIYSYRKYGTWKSLNRTVFSKYK
jgi:hypothetical protein